MSSETPLNLLREIVDFCLVENNIEIIEDVYTMVKDGVSAYKYFYTKAIAFDLHDRQLVFEKDIWLPEDIFIYKGTYTLDSIMLMESELEESNDCEFVAERLVSKLSDF